MQSIKSLRSLLFMGVTVTLGGCCSGFHLSHNCAAARVPKGAELLSHYSSWVFSEMGITHRVYFKEGRSGKKSAAILILHEMPTLTHECLDLANRLQRENFSVYLPHLFGSPEPRKVANTTFVLSMATTTLNREWRPFTAGVQQPISGWLHMLLNEIKKRHRHKEVAVIGMCFTGAIPIELMDDDSVALSVVCQPALPMLPCGHARRSDLGVSRSELTAARRSHATVIGIRFCNDTISTSERFDMLKATFQERFKDWTVKPSEYSGGSYTIPQHAHATLTQCYRDVHGKPYPPLQQRFDRLIQNLHLALD